MKEAPKQSVEAFAKELFDALKSNYTIHEQAKALSMAREMVIQNTRELIDKHEAEAMEARNELQVFIEIMEGPKQEYCGMSMPPKPFSGDELRKYQ